MYEIFIASLVAVSSVWPLLKGARDLSAAVQPVYEEVYRFIPDGADIVV